jgi:hypothetical protein
MLAKIVVWGMAGRTDLNLPSSRFWPGPTLISSGPVRRTLRIAECHLSGSLVGGFGTYITVLYPGRIR